MVGEDDTEDVESIRLDPNFDRERVFVYQAVGHLIRAFACEVCRDRVKFFAGDFLDLFHAGEFRICQLTREHVGDSALGIEEQIGVESVSCV